MNTFASNSATTSASSIGPLVRLPRCKFSPVLPNSGAGCPPKPRFSRSTVLRIEWITGLRDQNNKQQALHAASILSIPWYHDKDWPTMRNCFQLDTFDWSYLLSLANPETRKVQEIWRTAYSFLQIGSTCTCQWSRIAAMPSRLSGVCTMIHRNIVDCIHRY